MAKLTMPCIEGDNMPRYKITEYREVNHHGLSASATSRIHAKDLADAQLYATCINRPKGKWQYLNNGVHMIGSVKDGNVSIIEELENPQYIEYDLTLAFRFATFKKSEVYKAFCDFMRNTGTYHWLHISYAEILKEKFGIDFYIKMSY